MRHISEKLTLMKKRENREEELNEVTQIDNYSPEKTGKAYKVFRIKNGKLYPPMVANRGGEDTPVGVWIEAEEGEFAGLSKTGRKQVKQAKGGQTLSYRPGWHLGDIPRASQFDRTNKETGEKEFPKDFVWAECDYVMDIDYQPESDEQGYMRTRPDGTEYRSDKYQHSLAGLHKIPKNGYYKYRTNPRPDTVPWVITGAIKVNRILDDYEVNDILRKNGISQIHRQGGDRTLKELGLHNLYEDFIPYDKMSKKQKKEIDRQKRGELIPPMRVAKDASKYDRKRDRKIDLDESYGETKYEARGYYRNNYSGLEDYLYTNDEVELEDWVWDHIAHGSYIEVCNTEAGKCVRLSPDNYDFEYDDYPAGAVMDDLRPVFYESYRNGNEIHATPRKGRNENMKIKRYGRTIKEDTVKKSNGKWTNKGDSGETHGEFKTKKKADAQRKAMFANGYKAESLTEDFSDLFADEEEKEDTFYEIGNRILDDYTYGGITWTGHSWALELGDDEPDDYDISEISRAIIEDNSVSGITGQGVTWYLNVDSYFDESMHENNELGHWYHKDKEPNIFYQEAFSKPGGPFWYRTNHGVQPGSVPKGIEILDVVEKGGKSWFLSDKVLTTSELDYYDIYEERPPVRESYKGLHEDKYSSDGTDNRQLNFSRGSYAGKSQWATDSKYGSSGRSYSDDWGTGKTAKATDQDKASDSFYKSNQKAQDAMRKNGNAVEEISKLSKDVADYTERKMTTVQIDGSSVQCSGVGDVKNFIGRLLKHGYKEDIPSEKYSKVLSNNKVSTAKVGITSKGAVVLFYTNGKNESKTSNSGKLLREKYSIRVLSSSDKEFSKLSRLAEILTRLSPNGYNYFVGDTYFDYGMDWRWTTVLCSGGVNGGYQALNPREQEEAYEAETEEELIRVAENILSDKYCPDRIQTVHHDYPYSINDGRSRTKKFHLNEDDGIDDHTYEFEILVRVKDEKGNLGSPTRTTQRQDAANMQKAEELVRAEFPNAEIQIIKRQQIK